MKNQEATKPENTPSMDEILQSIRGVINDDLIDDKSVDKQNSKESDAEDKSRLKPLDKPSTDTEQRSDSDVLELTELAEVKNDEPIINTPTPLSPATNAFDNLTDQNINISNAVNTEKSQNADMVDNNIKSNSKNDNAGDSVGDNELPDDIKSTSKTDNQQLTAAAEVILPAAAQSNNNVQKSDVVNSHNPHQAEQAKSLFDQEISTTNLELVKKQSNVADTTAQSSVKDNVATTNTTDRMTIDSPIQTDQDNNQSSILASSKKSLISQKVADEASVAIRDLMNKKTKPQDGLKFRTGGTIEDLVIESLKPYLSKWLDDNLSAIVKNLVEKEIKKLVPSDD